MNAQSVVGSWKRTSSILEYKNGKLDDLQKMMLNVYPCMSNIQYIFDKNGKHYLVLPAGCEKIPNEEATWKMVGNEFYISQKVEGKDESTQYNLSFEGNTLTMSHTYTEAEKQPTIKRLVIKYQKL
jgi:Lipocalin-like domain